VRLVDLNPAWLPTGGEGYSHSEGNSVPLRERVGIAFDCPDGCGRRASIIFRNPIDVGPSIRDDDHVWTREGDTFETLTLTPSIQRVDCPNRWHGHITNGEITP